MLYKDGLFHGLTPMALLFITAAGCAYSTVYAILESCGPLESDTTENVTFVLVAEKTVTKHLRSVGRSFFIFSYFCCVRTSSTKHAMAPTYHGKFSVATVVTCRIQAQFEKWMLGSILLSQHDKSSVRMAIADFADGSLTVEIFKLC